MINDNLNDKDKERCQRRLYSKLKASAKSRDIEFTLSRDQVKDKTTSLCFYCGHIPSNKLKYSGLVYRYNGLDRIDNDKGYTDQNTLPACRFCNSLRGPMNFDTWAGFISGVITFHGGRVPDKLARIKEDENRPRKSFYRFG